MTEEEFDGFGIGQSEDYRQAQWLAIEFNRSWRYDHTAKQWHGWDGKRWAPDKTGKVRYAVAKLAAKALFDAKSESMKKSMTRLLSIQYIDKALLALSTMPEYGTDGSDWDQIPYLLGCTNGVVDLRTNTLDPNPDPSCLVTRTTGHKFIPISDPSEFAERAPVFMEFMHEVMSGDDNMVLFLLQWFGASIFGFSPEQRFLLMIGIGRNGKGTLKNSVMAATGEYGKQPDANVYMRAKYGAPSSAGARADLMDLKGRRIGFFSEPEGGRFNEEMLKAHTGGDQITARALYSNNVISWEPTHSITFLVNNAPELEDIGPSMANRVMVADFRERYEGDAENKRLGEQVKAEADGILAILCWCAKWWYDQWESGEGGLHIPERVIEQSKKFMDRGDPVAHFINDNCRTGAGEKGQANLLYEQFTHWHYRNDEEGEPMGRQKFAAALERKGFKKVKRESGLFYVGIAPKSAVDIAMTEEDE